MRSASAVMPAGRQPLEPARAGSRPNRRPPRWPEVAAGVALAWSAAYALLGWYWTAGGAGFPFGRNDRHGPEYGSLLTAVDRTGGAVAIGVAGSLAVLVALALRRPTATRPRRWLVLAAGAAVVITVVGVAMDARSMTLLPPLGLFGWLLIGDWPTLNQLVLGVGALAWIAALAGYASVTRPPPARPADRRERDRRLALVGTVAALVAAACPLPYAVIRWSWTTGHPIGAPRSFVAMLERNQPGVAIVEAVLASFAVAGAALTLGLVMRWGRCFPTWVPLFGGRPVPAWLPLGLGSSAAVAIFPFGRGAWYGVLGIHVAGTRPEPAVWGLDLGRPAFWGVGGLGWLFPLWSLALGLALAGHAARRRLDAEGPAVDRAGTVGIGTQPDPGRRRRWSLGLMSAPSRRSVCWPLAAGVTVAAVAIAVLPSKGDTAGWIVPAELALPAPTGPAPVGVRTIHLVDRERADPAEPSQPRQLMASVFYPAAATPALEDLALAPYLTEPVAVAWGRPRSRDVGLRDDAVDWQTRIHAREWAPVAATGPRPTVILSPAPGELRASLTGVAEELASLGSIVVVLDHPGQAPVVELPGRHLVRSADGPPVPDPIGADLIFVSSHLDALGSELAALADPTRISVGAYRPLSCEEVAALGGGRGVTAVAQLGPGTGCAPNAADGLPPLMAFGRPDPADACDPLADAAVYLPTLARRWPAVASAPGACRWDDQNGSDVLAQRARLVRFLTAQPT